MSQDNGRQVDERLDAYVDGTLDPRGRAEFERRLASDAALRADIQRQRAVDASLERLFATPAADRVAAILRSAQQICSGAASASTAVATDAPPVNVAATENPPRTLAKPLRPFFRRVSTYAYAATLLLLVGGGWWLKTVVFQDEMVDGPPQPLPYRQIEPAAAIQRIVDENYEPDVVCKDDQQFAALAWKYTKQGLLLPTPLPTGVEVVGWSKGQTILSRQSLILMVKLDGQWAYVIVDTLSNDRPLQPPPGFRVFRGSVGNILLYEVTPLDEPKLLSHFFDPKKDEAWYRAGMVW